MTELEPTVGVDGWRRVPRGLRAARAVGLAWQPRRWWVRVGGLLLSVLVTTLVLVLLALAGTTSASHGWLPAAAALLPGFLLGAFAAGWGRWNAVLAYSLVLALLVGGWLYRTSPPTHERIESVAGQVGVPESWERATREATGSTWCLWSACPEIRYVYATADSDAETRRDFTALLEADGWDKDDAEEAWRDDPENHQDWHKGRWHVTLNILPAGAKGREYDTTIPQDLTEVSILYRG